ncbi:MAG TPA: hypothetical protein VEG24_03085 [Gaiellaceae bacterium]|nr:hypothetical protein [Gaiellaceae bacterium]
MALELSIPVLWAVDGGPHVAGRLDLYRDRLHLDGGPLEDRRTMEIEGDEIAAVRIGRTDNERIEGRVALVVELRDGSAVSFTGLHTLGTLHELAERLEAMAGAGPDA